MFGAILENFPSLCLGQKILHDDYDDGGGDGDNDGGDVIK